ncbi:3-hydroxyacyl-CoA dehydrogenase family protein [Puniceicoccaceae bacterium K14]|nr:3-hydroxyacyl-CoA dehydrogenase family protein [Puniceicoccaceae bacterium K14]
MEISTVAVIGVGTIGSSVVADLVIHGFKVIAVDVSDEALENAKGIIRDAVRFAPMLDPKLRGKANSKQLENIEYTTCLEDIHSCDFVIENVSEKWSIKEGVYGRLEEICSEDVIFGVNTSCLSITKIGGLTNRSANVIGMHFMNPSYLKPVIEVMRGFHTSDECVQRVDGFLTKMDKTSVVVNDFPGFVSNRVSHLFMNEAAFVVQDQVADPGQVDAIFRDCFGHKMGPLETADLIGLDTVVDSLEVLYETYQDSKFRCCPILKKMVEAGLLGKKSGKGFFDYS